MVKQTGRPLTQAVLTLLYFMFLHVSCSMRIWSNFLIISLAAMAFACGAPRPATPVETFKTYTKAAKNKDYTTMKLLLSAGTIKMHEQEAKAQGVTVDDIIKRETLLGDSQKTVDYR